MPWSAPTAPVTSTVITVAYAVANIVNPVNWLRQLTGGADPPGSNYAVVSSSTTATSWRTLGDLVISGLELATRACTATVAVNKTNVVGAGLFDAAQFVAETPNATANPAEVAAIGFHRTNATGVALYHDGSATDLLRLITNGGVIHRIWTSANHGPGSGLNADLHEGLTVAQIRAGVVPVPSGLIGAFRTAAAIPAGWTRFTDGDGRLLVGAGASFEHSFAENSAVGSSWAHSHAATGLTTSVVGPNAVQIGTGRQATDNHSHTVEGNTSSTTWTPVARVVVHAIKT